MRITNRMLSDNFLSDMRTNLQNMQTVQRQLSSGKEISKPSDDPIKVVRTMQLNADLDANTQYKKNIQDTSNWLDTTDTALGQAGEVLKRIDELLVSAGNAGYSQNEKNSIKDEINSNIGQMAQILNTNFDGSYVFGGSRGTYKPVSAVKDSSTGNMKLVYIDKDGSEIDEATATDAQKKQLSMIGSDLKVEISQGVIMKYNVTASEALKYGSGTSDTLNSLLSRIVNHLDGKNDDGTATASDAYSKLTGDDLKSIKEAEDSLLSLRSQVGANQNRMTAAKDKNTAESANMTEILSKTEDIDITEKTMDYATAQTVYTASLQTSAKIIQKSLLDYLT